MSAPMLIRQSALYVLARFVPGIVSMGTAAILTRVLTPDTYGKYALAMLIMLIGAALLFDWMGVALVRIYAGERKDDRTIEAFLQIFLGLGVALLAVMLPVAFVAGPTLEDGAPYLLGTLLVITYSGFELIARIRVANFEAGRYLGMNLGRSVLIMACALPIAALTHNGLWTAGGTALGMAGGTLLGIRPLPRIRLLTVDRALIRQIFHYGIPIGISMMLASLVNSGTRALLGSIGSAEQLGYYTAAFVLIQNTLSMLANGLESAAFPLAVAAVERGDEAGARDQLVRNSSLLLAMLAPAAIGMAVTAPGIAHCIVGAKFEPMVAELTPWMCLGGLFGGFRANYLDHAFQLGRRPHLQVWVTAVSGILAMGLAAVLIPDYGAVGAAIAVAVAMGVSCVHALLAGRLAFPLPFPSGEAIRVLVACGVMVAVVHFLPGITLDRFLLQVVAGALAYGVAAFAFDVLGSRRVLLRWWAHRS